MATGGKTPSGQEVVARWEVPTGAKLRVVEFEHGSKVSGKRVIWVDGRCLLRREFNFNLTGNEVFSLDGVKCKIQIGAQGWDYTYTLLVNGKPLKKFVTSVKKGIRTWLPWVDGERKRIVLEIGKMQVHVDGRKVEGFGEFAEGEEDGTTTHFRIGKHNGRILTESSGDRLKGLIHSLYIEDKLIPLEEEGEKLALKVQDPRTPES